jgi:hypothetical protein
MEHYLVQNQNQNHNGKKYTTHHHKCKILFVLVSLQQSNWYERLVLVLPACASAAQKTWESELNDCAFAGRNVGTEGKNDRQRKI